MSHNLLLFSRKNRVHFLGVLDLNNLGLNRFYIKIKSLKSVQESKLLISKSFFLEKESFSNRGLPKVYEMKIGKKKQKNDQSEK